MDVVELEQVVRNVATRADVAEEEERTRRHIDRVAERLENKIQLIAEGQVSLRERFEEFRQDITGELAQHDRRLTHLEASRPRRSPATKSK